MDDLTSRTKPFETLLCDLDGVLWLAHQPIDGAADAIARVRATGRRVLFVTNNSAAPVAAQVAALGTIGVPAQGDVLSSAMAAAGLVESGERVLVTGGPGVVEAVEARGAIAVVNDGTEAIDATPFDVVMVGLHRDFDYARLTRAAHALHGGARLIGTNSDTTYPTPDGLDPGGGSIVAAVAAAGEATPTFGGKPHPPMASLIAATLSTPARPFDPLTALMIGDRPETDGLMASTLGCPFALVRSGVTKPGVMVADDMEMAFDVADLAAVVDVITGHAGGPGRVR